MFPGNPNHMSSGDLGDDLSRDMTSLASTFRRSGGRQEVARRAATVDLDTLSQQNLTLMLSELFHDGGVTQERLMVLFYFCSDLAVRAVKTGLLSLVSTLTSWSLTFIRGTVSAWVRCRGGWSRVLASLTPGPDTTDTAAHEAAPSPINQVAFVSACAAVVGVCAVYIKKNL